jgi:hypothetical protein
MKFDDFKFIDKYRNLHIFIEFSDFIKKLDSFMNIKNNQFFLNGFQFPSDEDVELIENGYDCLIPFMVEITNGQHDIYCYDFEEKSSPQIVVFSDHSIVNKWSSVSEFFFWLNSMANTK